MLVVFTNNALVYRLKGKCQQFGDTSLTILLKTRNYSWSDP